MNSMGPFCFQAPAPPLGSAEVAPSPPAPALVNTSAAIIGPPAPEISRRRFMKFAFFGGVTLCASFTGVDKLTSAAERFSRKPIEKEPIEIIAPERKTDKIFTGKKPEGPPLVLVGRKSADRKIQDTSINNFSEFMEWYGVFSKESPYVSGVATSLILGGWIRLFGDYLVRRKMGENYEFTKWSIFYPANAVYCSAEKVFVFRLLDGLFPIDKGSAMTSGNRNLMGAGRTLSMNVVYSSIWLWRHMIFMDWVDKGKAPFPKAFSKDFVKSSAGTWLSGTAWHMPMDWIVQTYVPLEFRILGSMILQAMPMQAWYTYRQLSMKNE